MPYVRRHRRQPGAELSAVWLLLFLGDHLARLERWPPVTLALVAGMVSTFFQGEAFSFIPSVRHACLQPKRVVEDFEVSRLVFSAFLHADELHLAYNMASLLWKGSKLEPRLGSVPFLGLIAELLLTSQLFTVAAAWLLKSSTPLLGLPYYSCGIGFSGVLFALKVVLNSNSPHYEHIAGIGRVPAKFACWVELFAIQLFVPRASFLGHLGGILAGLLHVHGTRHMPRRLSLPWTRRYSAYQGRPQYASSRPSPPPMSHHRRHRWSGARLLWAGAVAVAVAGVLVMTNPSADGFLKLAANRSLGGFARNTGFASTSAAWVRKLLSKGARTYDWQLFSWGRFRSLHALGILGVWLPVPVQPVVGAIGEATQPLSTALQAFTRDLEAGLQPVFPGITASAQAVLGLQAVLVLLWKLAGLGILRPGLPLRHLEVSPDSLPRRPWAVFLAPFSQERLSEALADSLGFLCLASTAFDRLGAAKAVAVYALTGAAAHLCAVLLKVALRRRQPGMLHSKGGVPALAGLLAFAAVIGLAGQQGGGRWSGRLDAGWVVRSALPIMLLGAQAIARKDLAAQLGCCFGIGCGLIDVGYGRTALQFLSRLVF